ncbi:MAG: hypothetical protein CMN85_04450 [Spongiibacteraceae bacterium]|nr:hypothetical protein [Spongiibacteraceae bacterium]
MDLPWPRTGACGRCTALRLRFAIDCHRGENRMAAKPEFFRQQQGVVLVMCLIFMLLMTIISGSALQSTTLQERMAGNARDSNSAFQAAEAALREGERILQGAMTEAFDGSGGLYRECSGEAVECNPPDWSDRSVSNWASLSDFGGGVSSQPNFYIEELPNIEKLSVALDSDQAVAPIKIYRITARGFGVSDKSMVVLRSIYRRE